MKTKIITVLACITVLMLRAIEPANAQVAWTFSQTVNSVEFYYSIQECDGDNVVFLKFVNNNSGIVTANWTEVFDTQAGPGQVGHFGQRQMLLAPGVTAQTDCSAITCPECLIVCEEMMTTYKALINGFSLDDITVIP